jgi:short-subunit dehydrogenase
VNITGVSNGVQAIYPVMVRQGFGHIINTASMAGLMPTPMMVSYGAAKHAVVGLSTSLRVEAAFAGVRVSVLCPGVIRTPILSGGKYGKMLRPIPVEIQERTWKRLRPMDPAQFARQALGAIARNRAIIILPAWWRLLWWINRLSPALGMALSRQLSLSNKRQMEQAERNPL